MGTLVMAMAMIRLRKLGPSAPAIGHRQDEGGEGLEQLDDAHDRLPERPLPVAGDGAEQTARYQGDADGTEGDDQVEASAVQYPREDIVAEDSGAE